ncbi:MAG TPA: oligopeptide:H+ symporter [Caulobacteraceae bacterium]|nr:oligopeptide:H+ symporter [Caulobacteraceae bacterium]
MDIVWLVGIAVTVATAVPVLLQLRGHPRGLFVLFFAEMWERFSYYGMRGLLIFYLTEQFLFDDRFSSGQYGAYTAMVYLLPLIGGFAADRLLGARKAIAFGALLLVAGHFTMAVEARPAVQTLSFAGHAYSFRATGRMEARRVCLEVGPGCYAVGAASDGGMKIAGLPAAAPLPRVLPKGGYRLGVAERDPVFVGVFYLALSLIIMGVGFLKANISSIVGQLYREGDPRRDPGFTLYYYGINLGAFWAAILCGWLGTTIGWWAGFGAAGVGMLAGYLIFVLGKPLLEGRGEPPSPERLKTPLLGPINAEWSLYLAGLAGVGVVWLIIQRFQLIGYMLGAGSVAALGYLGWFMATKCTRVERDRMILALILIGASVIFWTMFEQAGSSLNQFADRNTQLRLTATQSITAPQIQSFNAGFILIGAPVVAALWAFLGRRRADPNPVIKFALGLMQVGLSFLIIVLGSRFADAAFREPLVFLALAYVVQTTGELCLSPVGLSQMTKLSPPLLLSTVMATWFLASSWAQWLGGFVAQLTAAETVAGQVLDPAKALATYVHVYGLAGWITFGLGVALAAASPILKRLAHGASDLKPSPRADL